jgi:membrane fusion protein, multidrug efflux system
MKISKRTIAIATLVIITSIGGAYAYNNLLFDANPQPKPTLDASHPPLNPNGSELVVRAFTIQTAMGASRPKHAFTGSLQPRYLAAMAFRVAGKISQRIVEVGQRVKKGDVLFRLDPEDFELQLRVAESEQSSALSMLKQSTAEEGRLQQLRRSDAVSVSDYDMALANRDVAKARLESANRRMSIATNQRSYCDLIADSDGLVTSIAAEAGQVVNVGQTVLQLMQNDELEAIVSLPENFVSNVKNLKASALFWSHPDRQLQAELRELSPIADPVSRTYDARFKLLEKAPDLTIGMTVTIQLDNRSEDGLCVPITSIASRNDKPILWRIEPQSGRVAPIAVEIVQYRTDTAIIRGPFESGDQIVSAGVQRIDENSLVRIWESKK